MSIRVLICCVILPIALQCGAPSGNRAEALRTLKKVAACNDFWVQIHAIEYMAALGYQKDATAVIAAQLQGKDTLPQKRIGVWRASYLCAMTEADALRFLNKIVRAYVDTAGTDRVHAAETLAKLGYSLRDISPRILEVDSTTGGMLAAFVNWGKAISTDSKSLHDYDALLRELTSDDAEIRKLAAFGLGYLGKQPRKAPSSGFEAPQSIPMEKWQELYRLALNEDTSSIAHPYLISTAYSLYDFRSNPYEEQLMILHKRLISLQYQQNKSSRIELCRALATHLQPGDEKILEDLMKLKLPIKAAGLPGNEDISADHPINQDVQAAAAFALLSH